jgi:hypothetical protein
MAVMTTRTVVKGRRTSKAWPPKLDSKTPQNINNLRASCTEKKSYARSIWTPRRHQGRYGLQTATKSWPALARTRGCSRLCRFRSARRKIGRPIHEERPISLWKLEAVRSSRRGASGCLHISVGHLFRVHVDSHGRRLVLDLWEFPDHLFQLSLQTFAQTEPLHFLASQLRRGQLHGVQLEDRLPEHTQERSSCEHTGGA